MARATRARLQTAYDAGRAAAGDGTPPPDYIAGDADLLGAWDDGMADAQDGLPTRRYGADGTVHQPRPPRPKRSTGRARKPAPAADELEQPAEPTSPAKPSPAAHPVAAATGAVRRLTLTPHTDNLGGFVLGVLLYAVGISYIRSGPAGPLAWFRAKFENKPLGATGGGAPAKGSTGGLSPIGNNWATPGEINTIRNLPPNVGLGKSIDWGAVAAAAGAQGPVSNRGYTTQPAPGPR